MKKKILIADDSETVVLVVKMILARESCELIVAHDGQEALEKALVERPNLVLLDVMMPRLSGLEVLRRLRQNEATRTTPVVLVTTRGETANIRDGYAEGCSAYLTKPFDAVDLLRTVRRYLGG
jgi:CheY-like chemotaxis protein